jgi:hypothetical protein
MYSYTGLVSAAISPQQHLALVNELATVVGLARRGLGELQSIDGANDFFHSPSLYLSSSLERLWKATLIVASFQSGATRANIRRYSHRLDSLLDAVVAVCFTSEYMQREAARDDRAFLTTDRRFRDILAILEDFATNGKYHDLDSLSGEAEFEDESPNDRWFELESRTMREIGVWEEAVKPGEGGRKAHRAANRAFVASLERAFRATARLYTLGPLGVLGRQLSPSLYPFLMLMDDQLGSTDYGPRAD